MSKNKSSVTVRMDTNTAQEIGELAESNGSSMSSIIRDAIDLALPYLEAGVRPNHARHSLVLEYNQIVLELLADKYFPGDGEKIIDAAKQRLRDFHIRAGSPAMLGEGHQVMEREA